MSNWDTETADTCKLPELIPDICNRCRCYDYCYRQMTLEDMEVKNELDHLPHRDPDRRRDRMAGGIYHEH